jgi:hypothetical protein
LVEHAPFPVGKRLNSTQQTGHSSGAMPFATPDRPAFHSGNKTFAAPKLDGTVICKTLRFADSFRIVIAT